jgi:hypothetical protein
MRRSTGGSILLGRLVALRVPLVIALLLVACSDQGAEPYDIDAAPVPGDFVDYYRSYSSEYMNEDRFGEIFDEVSLVEDEGRLVGPQFTLKIDKIVIADSHESFGSRRTFEASSGYELVVAQLADPRELAEYRPDFILESIDAVVEVDGGSRRLHRDISRGAGIIVVSVPVGSDPHLVIRHDGRRQVISLRTGTHHEVIEPFYDRTFWGQELNFRYSGFGRVVMGGIEFSGTATFDIYSLRLEYWHESIGYPSRGAWLILRSAPTNCNAPTRIGTGEGDLPLDPLTPMEPSDVFVLVDDGDNEYPANPSIGTILPDTPTGAVWFDVPSTFRSGTIHMRPSLSVSVMLNPSTWTEPLPDDSVDVDLEPGYEFPYGDDSLLC